MKFSTGVFWLGLNLFLPGTAAYTDLGVFTTACLSTFALLPSAAISVGKSLSSSINVA